MKKPVIGSDVFLDNNRLVVKIIIIDANCQIRLSPLFLINKFLQPATKSYLPVLKA